MKKDLIIIGAGPAGMAAGYFAKKKNLSFSIIESTADIGGNCRTLSMGDFKFDTGAHRFHDKNKMSTKIVKSLLKEDLKKVAVPSKIHWKNKTVDFPLQLPSIVKAIPFFVLFKIAFENFIKIFKLNYIANNFKEYAYDRYGKTLSELFLINYTEKLWGVDTENLSISITGNRLKHLNYLSILKSFFSFGRKNEKHIEGSFLYPKNGFGSIFDAIFNKIGKENIILKSPVNKIELMQNGCYKVFTKTGLEMDCDKIISTLPVNIFMNILKPRPPMKLIRKVNNINFRSLRLSVLFLNKKHFSNYASVYFPEKKYPFTRIYEPKNRSSFLAPKDKTCIVIEVPCNSSDDIFNMDESRFNDQIKKIMIKNCLIDEKEIIDQVAYSMHYAYPQLLVDDSDIEEILSFVKSIKGIEVLGRSANFQYLHTHELLYSAEKCLQRCGFS